MPDRTEPAAGPRPSRSSLRPSRSAGGSGKKPNTRRALELVALRGRDVLGVRHLLEGGTAWVGNVTDALARVHVKELGGQPLLVGEVTAAEHAIYVPPRARARTHKKGGIPRLFAGPHKITLDEGERAVLVLGPVQIRAQVVNVEQCAPRVSIPGAVGWVAFIGAVYVVALGLCAAFAPPSVPRLPHGTMAKIHERFLVFSPSP
jgi:hypothetical protein